MPQEFKLVTRPNVEDHPAIEMPPFLRSTVREFIGLNGPSALTANGLLASPVQLEALMTSLRAGESLTAHIDFSSPKAAGLSLEIISGGKSRAEASRRGALLGRLLDAALASGLPCVEVRPRARRKQPEGLAKSRTLAPAGIVLPLGTTLVGANSNRSTVAGVTPLDWNEPQRDVIVFSATATGAHLAGLGVAIAAIKTPLAVEVRMTNTAFGATLLKQITDMRVRVGERLTSDAGKYVRDSRYTDADRRLEHLVVARSGITLDVCVRSRRALDDCEVSALSAALFGTPQDDGQNGHLASLRSLYPRDEAVHSFFGIVAAAIGPAIERRQVSQLNALAGNIIGKVQSGHTIRMAVDHPRTHTYMVGRPGSGKSTLLLNLILQDIENGHCVVLIDPHGDLWADIRARLPAHRLRDVQLVHMGDPEMRPELNLLELGPGDPAEARARVLDTVCQLVKRLMFSGLSMEATGPMFNKYFRAALLLLLEAEGANARIHMIERIFTDSDWRDELLERDAVSEDTQRQWKGILGVRGNDHSIDSMTPWITSKLTLITQNAILMPILSADKTTLDFDEVLAKQKVCLINLANGRLGYEAAHLIGGILTYRLEQSAKRQEKVALAERHLASVYFDEFHTFASEFLRQLMAETRKFGLRVTLANQTLSQMSNITDVNGGVLREVLGNCANSIVFAVDISDALHLAPRFGGKIEPGALVAQPNYQAICQFQTATGSLGPFVVKTEPAPPVPRGK